MISSSVKGVGSKFGQAPHRSSDSMQMFGMNLFLHAGAYPTRPSLPRYWSAKISDLVTKRSRIIGILSIIVIRDPSSRIVPIVPPCFIFIFALEGMRDRMAIGRNNWNSCGTLQELGKQGEDHILRQVIGKLFPD